MLTRFAEEVRRLAPDGRYLSTYKGYLLRLSLLPYLDAVKQLWQDCLDFYQRTTSGEDDKYDEPENKKDN